MFNIFTHSQPFRTRQLVFPGAKTIHDKNTPAPAVAPVARESHDLMFSSNLPKVAAAQTVVDAICHKQVCRQVLHGMLVLMLIVFAVETIVLWFGRES